MNRFLVSLYIFLIATVVGLSIAYPEDFAMALGFFVVGSLLGGFFAYNLFTNVHDKGFERSQKLSEKQVGNPASIIREARLANSDVVKQTETKTQSMTQIPQFTMTGLIDE